MFKSRLHMFEFGKSEPQQVFLTSEHGMYTYSDLERFTAFFLDIIKQKFPLNYLHEIVPKIILYFFIFFTHFLSKKLQIYFENVPNSFCTSIKAMALDLEAFIFSRFRMIPASCLKSSNFSSE